ncbi:uncharacterized protein THITE_2086081 [Thermothielavioides terrestris NRRL 8126]|uniref:Rieske domain-containing protein n=1 Tax=Thermothielavioides terrestris (strain ATCC 38088 / NRRL 8126) TaxID=578455 RepID=G2QUZ0_THETT|nr:uncharacterized protein THITE_2086081 [Thermothielavioides terrestris NRRL 8126]AEO64588.1 hypothetical protein THITE_2086081 [Thermothielavioides terrestris NRRL 8126]
MFTFFSRPRADQAWFSAGPASSYPDLSPGGESAALSDPRPCGADAVPGCKVFSVPKGDVAAASEVSLSEVYEGADLRDQVVVFQYRGKFHAIDHQCPHSSFPLSRGTPFDIEDFGIVLSAGITCPKHGWSFDLFSGMGDRGTYKLKTWEVELRPAKGASGDGQEKEVWVRRKQRIG